MKKWKKGLVAVLMMLCLCMTACGTTDVSGNGTDDAGVNAENVADTNQNVTEQDGTNQTDADEAGKADESGKIDEAGKADESGKTDADVDSKNDAGAKESESVAEEDTTPGLKDVFAEHGLKAGTCLNDFMIRDKKSMEIIKKNFNSVTFENHLKPDAILDRNASKKAGDLVVKFSSTTEKLLKWCKENEMPMRGHTLIWYSQTPSWIFYENFDTSAPLVSREVMLARMESYIRQVFELLEKEGYLDLFYAYDVVNEAWMEDGSKRDCLWLNTIGDDYLWQAFYFADKYAPEHVDLYYNDYNEQFKTDTLYDFVQTLKDENGDYLIDGIGFQAHLYTEDNQDEYFATMDKLASLGLKINLTELDVCLGSWPVIKPATEENLKIQGQYYYNLINGILQRVDEGKVEMDALTFWGFSDNQSWRKERNPLLYDKKNNPKYAYYGALQIKDKAGFDE